MEGYNIIGGNQAKRDTVRREIWGYKTTKRKDRRRERLALINSVKEEETLLRDRNEIVIARPNGPRENAEPATSCRGPGAARKKEAHQYSGEDAHMLPCGDSIE